MNAASYISAKMKFQGKAAMVTIAVASFVIIIAVAVSGGFRYELRKGIAELSGDIQITSPYMDYIGDEHPVTLGEELESAITALDGVDHIVPAVYRAGIVKAGTNIHGVIFKGIPGGGDSLRVSIPERLASMLGMKPGDRMLTYFIGEAVKVRNFNVVSVYEGIMDNSDELVVLADIKDLQRLNGWDENEVSMLEVSLAPHARDAASMSRITAEIGEIVLERQGDDEDTLIPTSVMDRYPQIFDWLSLLDFNVFVILILMTVVAGFNMVSGLLIMLFRNIPTIGTLKSLGMTDRMIAKVFLRVSSKVVLKGMLAGNALALAFCLIQGRTHLLRLNPENYFVSFVPVHVNVPAVIAADIAAFAVILLILLIPCLFISRIDPSKTVRAQ